jgi:TonB family protein
MQTRIIRSLSAQAALLALTCAGSLFPLPVRAPMPAGVLERQETGEISSDQMAGVITRQLQPAVVKRFRLPVAATPSPETGDRRDTAEEQASDKMPVYWNDALTTDRGGRIRLVLTDGSIVNLGQQTRLVVNEVNSRASYSAIQLEYGRVRAQVGHSPLPNARFEVRTNRAVCWVSKNEPTDVYVDAASPTSTFVVNLGRGVVHLQSRDGAENLLLTPGEASASDAVSYVHIATSEEVARASAATEATEGGIIPPLLVSRVAPKYTKAAQRAELQGTVVLYAVVEADGSVSTARVTRSLDPGLDQEAIKAVKQWKYQPGTKDGRPVRVAATIEVEFRLLRR